MLSSSAAFGCFVLQETLEQAVPQDIVSFVQEGVPEVQHSQVACLHCRPPTLTQVYVLQPFAQIHRLCIGDILHMGFMPSAHMSDIPQ